MRLMIRPEQMSVIQDSAEKKFERRLEAHLREHYGKSIVALPEDKKSAVGEMSDEVLEPLIRVGIERARSHKLSYESAISAFTALMFEVAPNFDAHELVQPFLSDETVTPNARLDAMLEQLTERDWETVRKTYDSDAWQPQASAEEEKKSEE